MPSFLAAHRGKLLIAGGLLGLLLILFLVMRMDAGPIDDDDLRVELKTVSNQQNGGELLMNVRWDLPFEEGGQLDDWIADPDIAREGGAPWDLEQARKLAASWPEAKQLLDEVLATEVIQPRALDDPNAPMGYLSPLRDLGRHSALQAEIALHEGKPRLAFWHANRALLLSEKTMAGPGTLIQGLVAIAVRSQALIAIRRAARHPQLGAKALETMAAELARYDDGGKAWQGVLRGEYSFSAGLIDQMASGNPVPGVPGAGAGYFFHPERTKAIFAKAFRQMIDDVERPFAELGDSEFVEEPSSLRPLLPNGVGTILTVMLMPALNAVVKRERRARADLRVTRLLLRIYAHRQREGGFPSAAQLGELPRDPFGSGPLRYDPARGRVWSVGENKTDDGGSSDPDHNGDRYADGVADAVWRVLPAYPTAETAK